MDEWEEVKLALGDAQFQKLTIRVKALCEEAFEITGDIDSAADAVNDAIYDLDIDCSEEDDDWLRDELANFSDDYLATFSAR